MKNKITLTLFFISVLLSNQAQNEMPCTVQDGMTSTQIVLEQYIKEYAENDDFSRGGLLTIPIVIHVVYNNATENISDAQILSQLDIVAQDYLRLNPDTVNTPSAFQLVAGDAQIEFCLAAVDPFGNATSGITRTYTDSISFYLGPGGGNSMKYDSSGGVDVWDPQDYLNIWVVNLANGSGSATNPSGHGSPDDGIVMDYTILTGTHLLSHEIGHYLNLMHIYGGVNPLCQGTDGGDQVSDTPDQSWSTFGCPTFPQTDSCTTLSPGIMFMNFMDQTSSTCQNLFTQGQVTRMRDALSIVRASLLSSAACNVPTSIDDAPMTNNMIIYPNPANDVINLSFELLNSASIKIEILEVSGRVLTNYKTQLRSIGQNDVQLDINSLCAGVYLCRLIIDGETITKRFIKQ